jgi:hypothetical protein
VLSGAVLTRVGVVEALEISVRSVSHDHHLNADWRFCIIERIGPPISR